MESHFARKRRMTRSCYERAEYRAGHPLDAEQRADLRLAIDDAIQSIEWSRHHVTAALGLSMGALDDGSLTTDRLRAALDAIRRLPRHGEPT